MSTTDPSGGAQTPPRDESWSATARTPDFARLRSRLRRFVFPMTVLFLGWYFLYVVLAAFAPHAMAARVAGNVNVGLVFGLLQFLTTFAITLWYVRYANRHLDPISSEIRARIEQRNPR